MPIILDIKDKNFQLQQPFVNAQIASAIRGHRYEYPTAYHDLIQANKDLEIIKKEFKRRKILKVMELEYQLQETGDELLNILYNKEKDLKKKLQVKMSKEHNNGYAWITINPKPSVKLEIFKKLINKIVKKTCFKNYVYVLEQRSSTLEKMGMGFHAHILIKRNLKYKPIKCKQNVIDTLKRAKVIGNWKHAFDYKVIGEEFASDKLDYILGLKTGNKADGTAKVDAQKIDVVWRQKNNIDSFYGDKEILSS